MKRLGLALMHHPLAAGRIVPVVADRTAGPVAAGHTAVHRVVHHSLAGLVEVAAVLAEHIRQLVVLLITTQLRKHDKHIRRAVLEAAAGSLLAQDKLAQDKVKGPVWDNMTVGPAEAEVAVHLEEERKVSGCRVREVPGWIVLDIDSGPHTEVPAGFGCIHTGVALDLGGHQAGMANWY